MRVGKNIFYSQAGFSLVESAVAMAIIALLTVAVVSGAGNNAKIERFSSNVRDFANTLREAQTKSYSIKTGSGTCTNPNGQTIATCYWRGNVLEYTKSGDTYALQLLDGDDLNLYASSLSSTGVCATADAQLCIEGKQLSSQYELTNKGVSLTGISITGIGSVDAASVAFLAPDGKMYSSQTIVTSSQFSPTQRPYSGQNAVTFTLKDSSLPNMTGLVTVDPASGSINFTVN